MKMWPGGSGFERQRGIQSLPPGGELLREKMIEEETYKEARQQYLSQVPSRLKSPEAKYPKREELHER